MNEDQVGSDTVNVTRIITEEDTTKTEWKNENREKFHSKDEYSRSKGAHEIRPDRHRSLNTVDIARSVKSCVLGFEIGHR